ncbi:F-box protein SKIP23-like [Castanea sativa]|uniref:F-box protein SKIP23-like n=1 Tax=Castanea sativa TaxID=21020 RepID=UPI003F64BC6D
MADWSRLPEEILVLISKRMQTASDVRHFQSVCTSWLSSVPPPKPPRRLKIPTYDRHVANHFYLVERTIYYVELPKTRKFCFVKVEEDEHGKMRMLHPLTNSKIKSSGSQNVLDSLNLHVFESNKECVLQYEPKNHAAWVMRSEDVLLSSILMKKLWPISLLYKVNHSFIVIRNWDGVLWTAIFGIKDGTSRDEEDNSNNYMEVKSYLEGDLEEN